MKRPTPNVFLFVFVSFICISCASVKLADTDADITAKSFAVDSGKSNIYIFRNEDIVLNTPISIQVNGAPLGNTGAKTYILAKVLPGKHTIVAKGENTEKLIVETEADRNYFIWLEVRLGAVTNHGHLHLVNKAEGKKGVAESRLIK